MAGIDELPYRDPRTAYGGAATATRPRIPVGTATPATMGQFQAAQAAAATPAPGIGAMPAPPQAATAPAATAAPTPTKTGIGGKMGALGPAAGAALVAAPEALDVGKVLANPQAAGIDVATQAAEGTGRAASTMAGALGGVKLGAMAAPFLGPFAPAGPVIGGIGGGIAGYYSANKAIEGGRAAAGVDTQSPVDRVPAPQPAAAGIGAMPAKQVQATSAPNPAAAGAPTNPASPTKNQITFDPKTKTYSGADVTAGSPMTGGIDGGRGTGRGSVTTLDMSEGRKQDQMALQRAAKSGTQAEPQPGPAMIGIGSDPAKSERNVNFDRNTALSRLESVSRLGGTVRERMEAMKAYAAMSSQPMPYDVQQAQDIGAVTQQNATRTQRDIATMQGKTARDVAGMNSDARVDAALQRSGRPMLVGGGQVPYIDPQTGETKMRSMPARVFDPQTKTYLDKEAAADQVVPKIATDPRAIAIKNDPNMSDAEKRKQLQALGYK